MAGAKSKATAKRRRTAEKNPTAGNVSTTGSGKRHRKGKKGDQVPKSRTVEEENARADNQISKLLNEVREAMARSAETGDDLDSDLEALKDAVKEAEEADVEEDSDADSPFSSDSEDTEMKAGKKSLEGKTGPEKNSKKKVGKISGAESAKKVPKDGVEENAEKRAKEHMEGDSLSADDSEDSDDASPAGTGKGKKPEKTNARGESESDSDDDEGAENHRADLDDLKITDPEFYKYLKENDAELLDFDAGSGSEEDYAEQGDEDGSGDEDDEEDEARAAAEAGLDVELDPVDEDDEGVAGDMDDIVKCSKSKNVKQKRDSKVIDLGYLRDLQSQLSVRRSSLRPAEICSVFFELDVNWLLARKSSTKVRRMP